MDNKEYAFICSKQLLKYFLEYQPMNYDNVIKAYLNVTYSFHNFRPWNCNQTLEYLLPALEFIQYRLADDSLKALYYTLSYFCFLNGKYSDAISYIEKSLIYSKEFDHVYELHWYIYIFIGEFNKAYDIVIKSIDLSNSYIDMGFVYHQLGKYNLALTSYQVSLDILELHKNDTKSCFIDIYIAWSYLESDQIMNAIDFSLKARKQYFLIDQKQRTPSLIITLYIILALIECQLENYYMALDYLGQAWEFIFNNNCYHQLFHRILYNHIGFVYYKLGQTEIAMKNYLKSLSLYHDHEKHPDLVQVYKNIGLIYEQDEKTYSIALSYYQRALELLPNNEHLHYIRYKRMIETLELKLKKKNET
jgi:tetratricopeptide (TPR) repeat protein